MEIQLILHTAPGKSGIPVSVKRGTTLKDLARKWQKDVPYPILAALAGQRCVELTYAVEEPCEITFLSLTDKSMESLYQRSVTFLYLKAVNDVLGADVPVEICHSISDGLYSEIKKAGEITEEEVRAVEHRMKEIVKADLPFQKRTVRGNEIRAVFGNRASSERVKLLERAQGHRVSFYSCDGFSNFFYGKMVPSAGYLYAFELRKYKKGVLLRFPTQASPGSVPPYREEEALYRAFKESQDWCDLMDIGYVSDLNRMVEDGSYRDVILISEALHEKKIAEIADLITRKKKHIIFIAGPSSSGKTTFARRLCVQLRVNGCHPLYLGLDDYFLDRKDSPVDENGNYNFEGLNALDLSLFSQQMSTLLRGESTDIPRFDFKTGCKVFGERITKIEAGEPIVIEGIHGLNHALHEGIPQEEIFKIYISPVTQLNIDNYNRVSTTYSRLLRRIVRDHQFRGWSAEETIRRWPGVREGENKNVFPYCNEADVFFNSVHIYELAVLKKYALPLLKEIGEDSDCFMEADYLRRFLRFIKTIEDDSIISNNSILREFIGGSIFVNS